MKHEYRQISDLVDANNLAHRTSINPRQFGMLSTSQIVSLSQSIWRNVL